MTRKSSNNKLKKQITIKTINKQNSNKSTNLPRKENANAK